MRLPSPVRGVQQTNINSFNFCLARGRRPGLSHCVTVTARLGYASVTPEQFEPAQAARPLCRTPPLRTYPCDATRAISAGAGEVDVRLDEGAATHRRFDRGDAVAVLELGEG